MIKFTTQELEMENSLKLLIYIFLIDDIIFTSFILIEVVASKIEFSTLILYNSCKSFYYIQWNLHLYILV